MMIYGYSKVSSRVWQPRIVCVEPLHDFGKITIPHQPRSNNESEPNNEPKADTKSEPNAESKSNGDTKSNVDPKSDGKPQPNSDPKPNSESETLAQQKLPHAKPTHEFIIKNEGNADLIIRKVVAGCGSCVEVESFTKTPIAPKQFGSVILKLLTDELSGKVSKEVLVQSNSPKNRNLILTLEAEIVVAENVVEE
jgi:hypothetical protein